MPGWCDVIPQLFYIPVLAGSLARDKQGKKTNQIVQNQEPVGNVRKAIICRHPAGMVHLICADIINVSSPLER